MLAEQEQEEIRSKMEQIGAETLRELWSSNSQQVVRKWSSDWVMRKLQEHFVGFSRLPFHSHAMQQQYEL